MKEVTYEEWMINPTPRMMWVWDGDEKDKKQRKVVYYFSPNTRCYYPVLGVNDLSGGTVAYLHCAEIEEPETEEPKTEKPETKTNKGFYVYNRAGSKPSYIHKTFKSAKEEAERIFNLNLTSNIKEPIEVLEIVARYTPKVKAEWE